MSRVLAAGLAAVAAGAAAVWLDPAGAARTIDAGAPPDRADALAHGVALLRALLALDAAILLAVALGLTFRRKEAGETRALARRGASGPREGPGPVWAMAALLVGAAALRAVGLSSDLWMDEVFTLVQFVREPALRILADFSDDNQHMLYSLLARASVSVLGEGPAALRLPALGFGLASLWATVRLGARHLGRREAWLAALLLAVSYHHVWFSQNARGYTILLFATLLSTDLLLRGLEERRPRLWAGYAAALALGMWAHLTMVFVGLAHALLVVALGLRDGPRGLRPLLGAAAGLAGSAWLVLHVYALTIPQMLSFFARPGAGSSTRPVEWSKPLWLITETLHHLGIGLAVGWLGILAAGGVFVWGLVRCLRRNPTLTAAMLLPALLGGATMVALGRSLWPRFFFHELGFAALIVVTGALGVGEAFGRLLPRARPALALAPALALCLVSAASLPRAWRLPKQDYTGARDFVRARLEPGDRVVGLHMAGKVYHLYYAPEWTRADDLAELERQRAREGRTWVLYTLPGYLESAQPELMRVIETEFEPMASFPGTVGDGVIRVRRSLRPPAAADETNTSGLPPAAAAMERQRR